MSLELPLRLLIRSALRTRSSHNIITSFAVARRSSSTQPSQTTKAPATATATPPSTKSAFKPPPLLQARRDPLEPARTRNVEDHILKPLARPIGLTTVPQAGQNSGVDTRTFQEKRDDFFDYDKHLARRKDLIKKVARPYFQDWRHLDFNRGKIFLAPVRLIRSDKALYFPNLRGITLADGKVEHDTTSVARGQITLVRIFSGRWAQLQADTWLEDQTLTKMFEAGEGVVQRIDLNVEERWMRALLVRLFMRGLRKTIPTDMHHKYFLVRRGFEEAYKHAIGMYNPTAGHVYLLDDMCRIRWGGSGDAQDDEKASLRRGIVRLAQELKERQDQKDKSTSTASRQKVATFVARVPSILT